jgi:serine/threonine protein kinase
MDLFTFASDKDITEAIFWKIIEQLLIAIQQLHNKKIAHTDIKLDNIGINNDLTVHLFDFGHAIDNIHPCDTFSAENVKGSFHYTAPEAFDEGDLTSSVYSIDYWELGVVSYALLSKRFPFGGSTQDELEYSIRYNVPPWKEDTINNNKKCIEFVNQLLDKEPSTRFSVDGDIDIFEALSKYKTI